MKAIKYLFIFATLLGGVFSLLQSSALAEKAGIVRITDKHRRSARPAIRQTAYTPQATGYNYYQTQTPAVQTWPVSHGGKHSAPVEYYQGGNCQTCNSGCKSTCEPCDDHIPIKIVTFRDLFRCGNDCEDDHWIGKSDKKSKCYCWWKKQKDMFHARMAYHHKVCRSHWKKDKCEDECEDCNGYCGVHTSHHCRMPYSNSCQYNVCDKSVYKKSYVTYPDKLGRCGSCRGRGCRLCGGSGCIQKGCNGEGVPPHGDYWMTYPVNPNYADARDARIYAAQGYGAPMAVPLAPTVRHTYNYGWGIPSSRITPMSQAR